jgi:hypothetical protein
MGILGKKLADLNLTHLSSVSYDECTFIYIIIFHGNKCIVRIMKSVRRGEKRRGEGRRREGRGRERRGDTSANRHVFTLTLSFLWAS